MAADLAGATQDGLANDRRRDHFVVEDDSKRQSDIFRCYLPEAGGARGVEAEGHHRLAGALIEVRLGVYQVLAGHQHLVLEHIRNLRTSLGRATRGIAVEE